MILTQMEGPSLAIILASSFLLVVDTAEILLVVPIAPALHSHVAKMAELGQALLTMGQHEVTWIVPDTKYVDEKFWNMPFKKVLYNIDENIFRESAPLQAEITRAAIESPGDIGKTLSRMMPFLSRQVTSILDNEEMIKELMLRKFDIAIIDNLFMMRHMYLIPARIGVPYITLADMMDHWEARAGWLPSFVPGGLMAFSERMSFIERVQNTLFNVVFTLAPGLMFNIQVDEKVIERYTKEIENYSSISDLISKSQLWLIQKDNLIDYVKPMMPNMINIGGFGTKPPKPLPEDLQSYVSSAEAGVIIVSFGVTVESLPHHVFHKMLKVFKKLPQKVLFRLKNNVTDVPENVKLMDWLPQNDLLANQNVKLFITHCGANGFYEAIYNGVPLIGMPIIGDQPYFGRVIEEKQYGISLKITSFTEDELLNTIQEVLHNPKYTNNIRKASQIFQSQPQKPLDCAVYWIEHVLQYGGSHLRSHALDMPWWQYLMVDVFTAIVAVILIVLYLFIKIVKLVGSKLCRSKVKKE